MKPPTGVPEPYSAVSGNIPLTDGISIACYANGMVRTAACVMLQLTS